MQIGNGFMKTSKNGKQYISIAFDKGVLALMPILNNIRLTLWYVKREERKSEKSPQWALSLSEPMEKTDKKDEEIEELKEKTSEIDENSEENIQISDEEIPF